jgi:hypothetical protein
VEGRLGTWLDKFDSLTLNNTGWDCKKRCVPIDPTVERIEYKESPKSRVDNLHERLCRWMDFLSVLDQRLRLKEQPYLLE